MCFAILRLFLYLIFFFRALFCTRDIYFTSRDQLERYYEDFGFGLTQIMLVNLMFYQKYYKENEMC